MDFNAHYSSWDDYVSTDPRGSALHIWMVAHSKVVLIDGSATQSAMSDESSGIGTLDVSLVDTVVAHRFSWEAIQELGSDHLQLLLIWDKDIKEERVHARRRPIYPKQIGISSTNVLTVSMLCYQSDPCQDVWRPSVT